MTMAKKSQTAELAELIVRHRANWAVAQESVTVARSLVRHAKALSRLNEAACNRPLTAADERAERDHTARVKALAEKIGCGVKFQGDPRGYSVKLHFGPDPKRQPGNTWGGTDDGWGIG